MVGSVGQPSMRKASVWGILLGLTWKGRKGKVSGRFLSLESSSSFWEVFFARQIDRRDGGIFKTDPLFWNFARNGTNSCHFEWG